MQAVSKRIDAVLTELSFVDEIYENQRLREDLGFDSLGLTELMVALEDAFEIEFGMEDLDPANFGTVTDTYALVGKYIAGETAYAG